MVKCAAKIFAAKRGMKVINANLTKTNKGRYMFDICSDLAENYFYFKFC
jgi:hypothetical protein